MATVIIKGSFVNNPSGNNIGSARFVHCVATGATQSVILKNASGTTLGNFYLHAAGDSVIVEKAADETITIADGHASAVGSPRS
tara:strand:+ start:455 stop:706 length:252 start_codon:yes stop_codon:yes gene_type:complete